MLKVSGIYVSPFEVEAALSSHPDVLEAAVVGWFDEERLVKPKAFVVLKLPDKASEELARTLQDHFKHLLAPYKYPRWIEFRSRTAEDGDGQDPEIQAQGGGSYLAVVMPEQPRTGRWPARSWILDPAIHEFELAASQQGAGCPAP